MQAKQILEMIEAVDPGDEANLDEIDARVWCWIEKVEYTAHESWGDGNKKLAVFYKFGNVGHWGDRYTRSRDALKQIRPEGWIYTISSTGIASALSHDGKIKLSFEAPMPNEELAELLVIMLVMERIEHERNQKS